MVEFVKEMRKIYHSIVPYELRGEIRLQIFKFLRNTKLLNSGLEKTGFLICKNHIQININEVEQTIEKKYKTIKTYKKVEEDITKPVGHLHGQELKGMQPFTTRTETVILDIRDYEFSLRNNYLLDQELNVITEFGVKFETLPIYFLRLQKATKVKGTVAYLSDPDPGNYYHWMCRVLPLIKIYQHFFDLSEINFFYIGSDPLSNFHKESLVKAGVVINRVIQEACTADRIVAAINSRTVQSGDPINKQAYLFTRNLFYNHSKFHTISNKNRIYVKRGNAKRRKVINEEQVINLLNKYGFESVSMDNKTIQEQAEIFSGAEAIIAPHGAALTNLLFIKPRTKVIELLPWGYVNNCFYAIASHGEANYFYLQCEKTNQGNIDVRCLDLYVDIQKLEKICKLASLE